MAIRLDVLNVTPTMDTSAYVAGVCAGTPTQTASGVKLMIGIESYS